MSRKIIGVDLRCLPQDGSVGAGVAHAARAICDTLLSQLLHSTSHVELKFYVPEGADWKTGDIVRLEDTTGRSLRSALKEKPCDLLFVPGGSVAPAIQVPTIPWVHDLIIFEHPEWFNQRLWQRMITTHLFKKGLKRAPIILAVSEYTKSKIVQLLGIDESKIIVSGEGGDNSITDYQLPIIDLKKEAKSFCEKELKLNRDFVLCLGTVEPRKNVAMLIRAWKKAKQKMVKVPDLVVAGLNGWKFEDVEAEIKLLTACEDQFFHRFRAVTNEQKQTLLLAAGLVAVPSLDEGFGLVALEAMQAGTPVAVSNRGALPEVVGEAGMLVDPQDEQAWASVMLTCAEDERACKLRSEMGLEQAKKFSWDKSAKIVIETLETRF